ncbi:MAG TPA: hypothetical protein VFT06_01905, partial [Flavisolibacter sp.]|nr:hypothetical protein [Flavisolibacter sp.]
MLPGIKGPKGTTDAGIGKRNFCVGCRLHCRSAGDLYPLQFDGERLMAEISYYQVAENGIVCRKNGF